MAVVYGFGGLRIKEDGLHLAPVIPRQWSAYSFKLTYRGSRLMVSVARTEGRPDVKISLLEGESVEIFLNGKKQRIG